MPYAPVNSPGPAPAIQDSRYRHLRHPRSPCCRYRTPRTPIPSRTVSPNESATRDSAGWPMRQTARFAPRPARPIQASRDRRTAYKAAAHRSWCPAKAAPHSSFPIRWRSASSCSPRSLPSTQWRPAIPAVYRNSIAIHRGLCGPAGTSSRPQAAPEWSPQTDCPVSTPATLPGTASTARCKRSELSPPHPSPNRTAGCPTVADADSPY